jgi:hypothetical protein
VLAFLVCAGLTALLRAQSSTTATGKAMIAGLPDDPSSPAVAANSVQGGAPIFDPFNPRPKFGISVGKADGLGFGGATGSFGVGVRGAGGSKQFGGAGLSEREGNLATFFPTDRFATDSTIGAEGTFGTAPVTLPTLNQLMRANLHAPLGSSSANFRLSYQERFGSIGNSSGIDFNHMLSTGMFTSSDLGNGMFLSAGAGSGGHSMAGAPAASLGNGTGAPKRSGASVAIKLSF